METGLRKHEHRTLPESFAASKVWSRPIMDSEFEIMDTQVDMFDSPLTGSVKGETSLMEYPFLDFSKRGRTKEFRRPEEHTSELQSLSRTRATVTCLTKKTHTQIL